MREWLVDNVGTTPVESFDWLSGLLVGYNLMDWATKGMTLLGCALTAFAVCRWAGRKVLGGLFGNSRHTLVKLVLQELRGDGVKWDEMNRMVSTNKVVLLYTPDTDTQYFRVTSVVVCSEPVSALIDARGMSKITKAAKAAISRCKFESYQIATDLIVKKFAQKTHYKA